MYKCERIEASPKDPPWNKFTPPLTFDEIYNMFITSGYNFIEPKYFDGTMLLDENWFLPNRNAPIVNCREPA